MINFRNHDSFDKEIAALEKRRLRRIKESLDGFKRLCEFHFHPANPQPRIHPGKLHRVTQNDVWTMWKTELPVIGSGLRPNQYPRIWFAIAGTTLVFLCVSSHIENYHDAEMDRLAISRAADFF